jgi:hypothetical protein
LRQSALSRLKNVADYLAFPPPKSPPVRSSHATEFGSKRSYHVLRPPPLEGSLTANSAASAGATKAMLPRNWSSSLAAPFLSADLGSSPSRARGSRRLYRLMAQGAEEEPQADDLTAAGHAECAGHSCMACCRRLGSSSVGGRPREQPLASHPGQRSITTQALFLSQMAIKP